MPSITESAARLSALVDTLPSLPDDVDGWLSVLGGPTCSIHIAPGQRAEAFDDVVAALEEVAPGRVLESHDAGWIPLLRIWESVGRVEGWKLAVVVRR